MIEYAVKSISDLLNAVVQATRHFRNNKLWWRGQAKADWGVRPSLYHKGKSVHEATMVILFRNQATVRHPQVPSENDAAGWLVLMRHYGLPTRLLDWTQSPLAGLFFAVREERYDKDDGALWGLLPVGLNYQQVVERAILCVNNHHVRPLFQEAFRRGGGKGTGKTLAIAAQQVDIRQMIQASEFTIHGSDTALNEMPEAEKFMVRIRIPADAKPVLRTSLDLLMVSESYLFPDLAHLSKELEKCAFSEE